MMLFIVLPEEETGFYLMRLNVVLHLANCDHMRYSVCTRLTKLFVASVSTAKFPIFGSSCLSQILSKYIHSEIFQTQLMDTERSEASKRISLKVKLMVYYCSEQDNFCWISVFSEFDSVMTKNFSNVFNFCLNLKFSLDLV